MEDVRIVVPELRSASVCVTAEREGYFPVVVSDGKGTAAVVQRGGAGHIGIRGRLDVVRTEDFGRNWGKPVVIVDSERDDRNPAVGLLGDGTLLVAYHWQGSYDEAGKWAPSAEKASTRFVTSEDGGRTWGEPYPLSRMELDGTSPYGHILSGPDGELLLPLYGKPRSRLPGDDAPEALCRSYLVRSTDNGRTWGDVTLVGLDVNEIDFAFLPNGELLAAMRTEKQAQLLVSRSPDAGRTWSEPVAVTSAGEHPGDLLMLSNGWVMLCYGRRHGLPGQPEGMKRCGVEGLLSRDSGHTWEGHLKLAFAEDLPVTDIGYPSSVHLGEGWIVTCYYANLWPVDEKPLGDWYDGRHAKCFAVVYREADLVKAAEQALCGQGLLK